MVLCHLISAFMHCCNTNKLLIVKLGLEFLTIALGLTETPSFIQVGNLLHMDLPPAKHKEALFFTLLPRALLKALFWIGTRERRTRGSPVLEQLGQNWWGCTTSPYPSPPSSSMEVLQKTIIQARTVLHFLWILFSRILPINGGIREWSLHPLKTCCQSEGNGY